MSKINKLAKMIDHSILHPTFGNKELKKGCAVAIKYDVASVCVKPYMVADAVKLLKGSNILVGCVIGFPSGNAAIPVKVFETENACNDGAVEIDMVINIGKALEGEWNYIEEEIKAVTDACHKNGAIVKVIFENDYITKDEDIIKLCKICTKVEADYVKTSSGFGFVKGDDGKYSCVGATIPHLRLMKESVGPNVKVKAAGGIRTLDQLIAVQETKSTRCGTTATITILEETKKRFE
ncbi:MAG: deoxyribose-phosphate aldolase [Flavobacteriaceae bacterium]|nr:deoxyribose-phosphate aldolase [Flavobacteriaceae bacterium]